MRAIGWLDALGAAAFACAGGTSTASAGPNDGSSIGLDRRPGCLERPGVRLHARLHSCRRCRFDPESHAGGGPRIDLRRLVRRLQRNRGVRSHDEPRSRCVTATFSSMPAGDACMQTRLAALKEISKIVVRYATGCAADADCAIADTSLACQEDCPSTQ